MRHLHSLVFLSVATVVLGGCATVAPATEGAESPSPSTSSTTTTASVDNDAAAKADSWLEAVVLPPEAVRSESVPQATPPFALTYYDSPCSAMEERTRYWTIAGAKVVDTANWLKEHPTAGLMDPTPVPLSSGSEVDSAMVGNVPEQGSLEGIAFTVSRTDDGVAIRAEVAVFTDDTVCPTLPPGESWGGPGQG